MSCSKPVSKKKQNDDALFSEYCKTRNLELRNQLLEKYLYIAEIIAKKFVNRGVEYDDLLQVASLSLIRAIERFDYKKGAKFTSFATPTLIGEIKNYFRDKTRIVKISRRDSESIKRMDDAYIYLTQQKGAIPTASEIAGYLGISLERVLELMETQAAGHAASLNSFITEDDEINLIQLMGTEDDEYKKVEDMDFINYCLAHSTDIEKKIITERFINEKSQREVSLMLNVSQMYVSRMERKIFLKFRSIY